VSRVASAITKHGGLKGKRLAEAAAEVAAAEAPAAMLGGRTRVSGVGELSVGANPGRYLHLKPVLPVPKPDLPA
jgi:hypothetical protein